MLQLSASSPGRDRLKFDLNSQPESHSIVANAMQLEACGRQPEPDSIEIDEVVHQAINNVWQVTPPTSPIQMCMMILPYLPQLLYKQPEVPSSYSLLNYMKFLVCLILGCVAKP